MPPSSDTTHWREEKSLPFDHTIDLTEHKEFTYWLFRYRVKNSDKARVASDTRKGLVQLQRMATVEHPSGGIRLSDRVDVAAPRAR